MVEKKNILIVAGVFPPEPIVSASIMYDLAMALAKTCNVTVLRPKPTRPAGFKIESYDNSVFPFKVIELDSFTCPESSFRGRFRESISSGHYAAKYIDAHHDEIDFIYNDPWQLFGVNIVARRAVKYGIPYIMAVQDIYPEALVSKLPGGILKKMVSSVLMPIDRYNQRHAACVHTISDKMASYLSSSRRISFEKYLVIRNWQNEDGWIEFTDSRQNYEYTGRTFMYLGNVGPLAGLDFVIDAFKDAALEGARLIIAGSGSARKELENKVVREGIVNVEFLDVPLGMIQATQRMADVMILPVKKGGAMSSIPSKLPAYMFSAKPVLASVDIESDTASCIVESDAGWVIEPENRKKLTDMFSRISCLDASVLYAKGQNGYVFAMKNLSRRGNLPKLVNAVKAIIG